MKVETERLAQLFGAASVGFFADDAPRPAALAAVPVVAPDTLDLACEVLRFASRERLRVLPAGAGEHLGRGAPPAGVHLVLSTRRLARVVEYEPEDMVLVAEAGLSLHDVERLAAPHGQRLGPGAWPGRAATLGGAVAANRSGLDRLARGTMRDALLGARVLGAEGRVSKTGARVVKNVAGYDLGKLYVGSCGSLVVLAEIIVRLAPRPPAAALVVAPVERGDAGDQLLAVHRSALRPAALLLVAGAATPEIALAPHQAGIVARFEGQPAAVRWQTDQALRVLGGEEWPAERATGAWDALRASSEPRADAALLRIGSLPVDGPSVLEALATLPAWERGGSFVAEFGVGAAHAQLPGATPRDIRSLRALLAPRGAHVAVDHAPSGLVPPAEPLPDAEALALQRLTKSVFDPEGRLRPLPLAGGAA